MTADASADYGEHPAIEHERWIERVRADVAAAYGDGEDWKARALAAEAKLIEVAEHCRDECTVVNEGVRLVAYVRATDILAIISSDEEADRD